MNDVLDYKTFMEIWEKVKQIHTEPYYVVYLPQEIYHDIQHVFHKQNRKEFMAHGKHGLKRPK